MYCFMSLIKLLNNILTAQLQGIQNLPINSTFLITGLCFGIIVQDCFVCSQL